MPFIAIFSSALSISGDALPAAYAVTLASGLVVIAILAYLNYYTRRRYYTIWTASWLFFSLWLVLNFQGRTQAASPWLFALEQGCMGIFGALLSWGAFRFLKVEVRQWIIALLIGFAGLWPFFGSYQLQDFHWATVPVFTFAAAASYQVCLSFFHARRRDNLKAFTLLGVTFLCWGLFLGAYPFLDFSDSFRSLALLGASSIQILMALGMVILVLEETRELTRQITDDLLSEKSEKGLLANKVTATEQRYQYLFLQAGDAIIITDAEHRILEFNEKAERLFGFCKTGCAEKLFHLPELLKPACLEWKNHSLEPWVSWVARQVDLGIVHKNGTVTPVEISTSQIELDGKEAWTFICRDSTPRARLEKQLRQAEKMSSIGELISSVAHELNNPLSVIKGYLDLILARHELSPHTRRDLEKVVMESNRAAKLVRAFLTFAREQPDERRMLDVNEIIERIVELRHFDFMRVGVTLVTDMDPKVPLTYATGDQIQQVLVILLNNALEALKGGDSAACVRVSTQLNDHGILLCVEDNGPGVAPEHVHRIFEPFYTTKGPERGTGLGLSIAHRVAVEHQGRLRYEASSLGGAGFYFEIPVLREPGRQTIQDPGNVPPAESLAQVPLEGIAEILVLDDELTVAELLGEFLEALGYRPTLCSSALQALDLIEKQNFDLIVSDFRMPVMDGRGFYEAIQHRKPELTDRIIFLTGDVVSEDTRTFLESSGAPHLMKPFQLVNVEHFVRQILSNRNASHENMHV